MRHSFSVCGQCLIFAWRDSFSITNGLSTVLGSFVLYALFIFGKIDNVNTPDGTFGLVYITSYCFMVSWIIIFIARTLYAPIHMIRQRDNSILELTQENDLLKSEAKNTFSKPNSEHKAFAINFEAVEPFIRDNIFSVPSPRGGTYVKVKNTGNGFLSECIVSLLDIRPLPETHGQVVLESLGSLSKGEHKYVLVASLNRQPVQDHGVFNDRLGFAFASGGGFFAGWVSIPIPTLEEPATLVIEAKALECRTETQRFQIWVDDRRHIILSAL